MTLATRWLRRGGYAAPDMVEVPEQSGATSGGVSRDAARWALPNFEDTDRASRVFPLSHHLGGEAGPWGGPNLEQTNLGALVDQPMAELGLEKYFDAGSETADLEAARISALESESTQLGSVSGLPFDVGQHAAARPRLRGRRYNGSSPTSRAPSRRSTRRKIHRRGTCSPGLTQAPHRGRRAHRRRSRGRRRRRHRAGHRAGHLDARRALRQILVAIRGLMARDVAAAAAAAAAASTANGSAETPRLRDPCSDWA